MKYSTIEKAFIIHLPRKQLKDIKSKNGLYYYKPRLHTCSGKELSLINHSIEKGTSSIKENKSLFTDGQVECAKLTRSIYHTLGNP